jgi:AbrB family looped-hinge helix DNA binding protein
MEVASMAKLVTMTPEGRVTIPANTRRELGIEGEAQFEVDVADESIVLRPAVVMTREDAWAYTPEHRRLLAKAHRDSRAGRVRRLTERDLSRLKTK